MVVCMNCSCCNVYCVQNRNIWRPARETGYGYNNQVTAQRKIKLHSQYLCRILLWCYLTKPYPLEDEFQQTLFLLVDMSLYNNNERRGRLGDI